MASIRDVAKEAGVASCTVSRVLNGTANVAPETEKKIRDAMKKLNYIPNELARGMFRKKANMIAMLVPNIQHPWFASLSSEIERIAYENGYKLILFNTDDKEEREKECLQTLKSNIVDGIICGTSACEAKEYIEIEKPIVKLDYKVSNKIPVIVSDHKMGAELAAQEFIHGHCKYVIHISGNKRDKNIMSFLSHEKLDEVLGQAGIRSRRVEICWNDFDFDGYFELAKVILEKYPEVDGIMAADLPAVAFLKAALAIGRRIPEDLKIVSYDGTFVTKTCTVELTQIRQPYLEIAKKAANMLFEMINEKMTGSEEEKKYQDVILPVELIKGVTTEQ